MAPKIRTEIVAVYTKFFDGPVQIGIPAGPYTVTEPADGELNPKLRPANSGGKSGSMSSLSSNDCEAAMMVTSPDLAAPIGKLRNPGSGS